ncbi:MAG: RNA-splicing ligase RtcB [Desulfuromonadales bacterium GWC2_61_20]|nr:MAG: RNA-splicing ligase RtcB [Desulfuromonadales bacterium GWC2_61_20]
MQLEQLDPWRWRIPQSGTMHSDGLVFASAAMMAELRQDKSLEQVVNVACLPGIVGPSIAMPDIHWGYGFPIGGVAAFDPDTGVVSPGGVGYDINCGVRLLRSRLTVAEIRPHLARLADTLFRHIPCGVGSRRRDRKLSAKEMHQVLLQGARWAVAQGFGNAADLDHIEAGGALPGADPDGVSPRAQERGHDQLGTLGSGNHFVEIQQVERIHDEMAAAALGLFPGQVTVSIHTGSRGLGYQVCDDYLRLLHQASRKYGIVLPDRQLCCAPVRSPEGQQYLAAMAGAANFAFANRQLITAAVRDSFAEVLRRGPDDLGMALIYDVCHNVAKLESHSVGGRERTLCVHRKGATRAYPPGHPETPAAYRDCGQPVLIPGDMGRYSYVLVGTAAAYDETYGSTCHGAGRRLSRQAALKATRGRNPVAEMAARGVLVRAAGRATVAEEVPEAYKDVAEVVAVVEGAGIGRIVARLKPLAVIKG